MKTVSRLVIASLTATTMAATPSAATATPMTPGVGARPIDCDPNKEFYRVGGGRQDVVTHRDGFHMVAHQTKTITKTAEQVKILKTDVSLDGAGKLSGNKITKILLSAELELKGHFARMSEETERSTITVSDEIKTNKKEGSYVAFAGYRYFHGWWQLVRCEGDGVTKTLLESGAFEAFDPAYKVGFALCPSTRYKSNTMMADACRQVWE